MAEKLSHDRLKRSCDPTIIGCETTDKLRELKDIIGQKRAVRALKFGLDIRDIGFNVYVSGIPGTGRETAVKNFLDDISKSKPIPHDWCYVNNFNDSYEPRAIKLTPGKGKIFKKDMENLVGEVRRTLPEVFQSEDYIKRREDKVQMLEEERNNLIKTLKDKAEKEGFVIQKTPVGLFILPVVDGKPLTDQQLAALDKEEREKIEKKREELKSNLRNTMREVREIEGKLNEEIEKLNRKVARFSIGHLIDDMKEKYKDTPEISEYLDEVEKDILDNLKQFTTNKNEGMSQVQSSWIKEVQFRKYQVNLIVDNSKCEGGPIIIEHNPTYQNLFGKIEKEALFGVLNTDFTMIRVGSLHKANGGYLVIPVEDLLRNIFSWDSLKRALMNGEINIEEAGERLGLATTKSLRPEPIPLSAKVILIGRPYLYNLLYTYDEDFKELFKVKADFDTTMDWNKDNIKQYSSFICTLCGKENLRHLNKEAVTKVVEYSARLAEDREKLSTKFADVADIIREANYYAEKDDSEFVNDEHIEKAIDEKVFRSNLIQEKIQEMIERGIILIDTEREVVGQVNGLSVADMGDFSFGRPTRVTASIGVGREGIIDIEREAKLGGKIHTKGVMILSGYMAEKYAHDKPLSLSARIVFEQSYGEVEGDSASSTELYAIISALSGLPIRSGLAVTGSVNQKGEIQAIGGVNEKIEGFFEVCKIQGLTGKQGVIIPESNIKNLMLKDEVIEAVKKKKFHIYTVRNIDDGIELLTGVNAGKKKDGSFEKDSVNFLVDKKLNEMAETLSEYPINMKGKRRKRKK